MGFNTSVLILNDALHEIKEDKEFGEKLYYAVGDLRHGVSIRLPGSSTKVVETHHADAYSIVAFGGNTAWPLGVVYCSPRVGNEDGNVTLLRELAASMGYYIRKKPCKRDKEQSDAQLY